MHWGVKGWLHQFAEQVIQRGSGVGTQAAIHRRYLHHGAAGRYQLMETFGLVELPNRAALTDFEDQLQVSLHRAQITCGSQGGQPDAAGAAPVGYPG
jgi:hypothetical protein